MRVITVWVSVFLAVGAFGWFGFYESFQRMPGTEIALPGRVALELDAGTYRIFVRNHIVNGNQCRPSSYADDIAATGMRLRPSTGPALIPVATGSCDGGTQKGGGFHPASVSEFRVEQGGRYVFTGERGPGMTAYGRPARAYLTDATHRWRDFTLGLGGALVGVLGAGTIATRQRRARPA
jgi:hypothetical protein